MQHKSPYANAVPKIIDEMLGEKGEQGTQPEQEPEITRYVYRTDNGGILISPTKLDGEDEPPTVESVPTAQQPARKAPTVFMAVCLLISIFALFSLIAIGVLTPSQQPEQRALIRVPAVPLPLKTFTTSVGVIPTGIKTYPATSAHGTLSLTNGSILAEELPTGMILTGKDGAEVITDAAVYVPAGSATGYGIAYVPAHAAVAGAAGNIQALDIDSVEGTALFIRNVQPFTGGADSHSIKFIKPQDRATALLQARSTLLPQTLSGLLQSPCKETVTGRETLSVIWLCQFVTYHMPPIPGLRVLHVQVMGKTVVLAVVYPMRQQRLETK